MSVFYKEKVQLKKEEIPQYLVLDGHFFWKYENGKWTDLMIEQNFDSINWEQFDVFINNSYYDTYSYVFNNYVSYFFDSDSNTQEVPSSYVLINKDSFLNLVEYNEVEFTDEDYKIATKFLEKNNLQDINLNLVWKYSIQDDGDLYFISNYEDTLVEDDIYCVVFYRKGNKNYMISKGNHEFNYDLYTVLDINKKLNNFILGYDCYDGICYEMYQYEDGNYVNVLE